MTALVLISIICAYLLKRFIRISGANIRIIIKLLIVLPIILQIGTRIPFIIDETPIVLGFETNDHYLSRKLKGLYEVSMFANKMLSKDAKIFSPWEVRGYYFDREFITGNSMFAKKLNGIKTCKNLIEKMKKMDFTHVLLNKNYHNTLIKMYEKGQVQINPEENLFYKGCMGQYLKSIYSINNVYLYKIL